MLIQMTHYNELNPKWWTHKKSFTRIMIKKHTVNGKLLSGHVNKFCPHFQNSTCIKAYKGCKADSIKDIFQHTF